MIFVTGDTHTDWMSRLNSDAFPEERTMTKDDYVIDSVFHLMRGQVFDINGIKFFAFGGASSHDIQDGILEKGDPRIKKWTREFRRFRINHVSWWEEELPSKEEIEEGLKNLKEHNNKVDFIITHSPYTSALMQMDAGSGLYHKDRLTDYLQNIKENVQYSQWFFGHMHVNQNFPWDKTIAIFEQIIRIA